jgi:phosphotransferase system HPr (HPr) family protein
MPTIEKNITVVNKLGLHARPAMQFVDAANAFASAVTVARCNDDPIEVDGKSVMAMITLEAVEGTPLKIRADGPDAAAAVEKLAALFAEKFGEE